MNPPHDYNPTTWMWEKFFLNEILVNRIFEYFKLVELAIVLILKSVEDEHAFSIITFMESKLKNCLTTNVDLVLKMYV
jgi:hypothetical protein